MIIVDGTVGAGKSTLAEILSKELNVPIYFELENKVTLDLLEEFYKDKKRWAFTLQIHFLNERFKMIKNIQKDGGILDRSIFGDRIFAQMLNEDGYMTNDEFTTYNTLLDNMLEHVRKPDFLLYIDCDLETAMERIKGRGREMELGVDTVYWSRLNDKYRSWYNTYNLSDKLSIDAKSYHPDNKDEVNNIINQVKSSLTKIVDNKSLLKTYNFFNN